MERRRHVRVRPTADHALSVTVRRGLGSVAAQVIDVSTSGLGLYVTGALAELGAGAELELELQFPGGQPLAAIAVVRHDALGTCGLELVEPEPALTAALRRYVGELMARGQRA